jgi:polyhydroxyalkanoate synthesis regulator phasin
MRGTVGETLERLILLQIGAAAATRDKVQEIVDSLVEQGRVEREEGRTVVNDVMNRARERSTGARSLVDASVQQGLRRRASDQGELRGPSVPHRAAGAQGKDARGPARGASSACG